MLVIIGYIKLARVQRYLYTARTDAYLSACSDLGRIEAVEEAVSIVGGLRLHCSSELDSVMLLAAHDHLV